MSRCGLNSDLLIWWVGLQGANAAFSLYVVVYDIDKYMDMEKYGRLQLYCPNSIIYFPLVNFLHSSPLCPGWSRLPNPSVGVRKGRRPRRRWGWAFDAFERLSGEESLQKQAALASIRVGPYWYSGFFSLSINCCLAILPPL